MAWEAEVQTQAPEHEQADAGCACRWCLAPLNARPVPPLQVALGSELARLLQVELPARDAHLVARQPGRLSELPGPLL